MVEVLHFVKCLECGSVGRFMTDWNSIKPCFGVVLKDRHSIICEKCGGKTEEY